MRITLYGAAGDVTGSAYHVQTDRAQVLIDFGMFQGEDEREHANRVPPGLSARDLDAILLTHAHIDHVGRLPLLIKAGFRGPIYCTPATVDMARLILEDSADIQTQDAERVNRKRVGDDTPPVQPMYVVADVVDTVRLCREAPYAQPVSIAPGITAVFVESGHMLGSASIKLEVDEDGQTKSVVFSGDIGPRGAPILRDAVAFQQADVVFLESTYGDRDHRPYAQTIDEFGAVMRSAISQRGKVLIPTFAVGRAQTMLYLLDMLFRRRELPPIPVYLDSPMAIDAIQVYQDHPELADEEARELAREQPLLQELDLLRLSVTSQDSRAINSQPGPLVVLASSGMMNAGRILHHLRHNLARPQTAVVVVGYQGKGTLGRRLVEGVSPVSIFGDPIEVSASIHTLNGFSAHAGQTELVQWVTSVAPSGPRIVLTHGEDDARTVLAARLSQRFGLTAQLPEYGQVFVF